MGINRHMLGGRFGKAGVQGSCPVGEFQAGPEVLPPGSGVAGPQGCLASLTGSLWMVCSSLCLVQAQELTSAQEAPAPSSPGQPVNLTETAAALPGPLLQRSCLTLLHPVPHHAGPH